MAKACGLSVSTVQRMRRAFGLQPHRSSASSFTPNRISRPRWHVVGIYMCRPNAPSRAWYECRLPALDRIQPCCRGVRAAGAQGHDYKRHGTTSLFAALDIATGAVFGKCYARLRARKFRTFLDEIEAAVPDALTFTSSWTFTPPTRRR